MVSASRKKLSSNVTVSIRKRKPSPLPGIKDLFKNKFPLDRKKPFSGRSLWKNTEKMVCTSQKIRFTTRNEAFFKKICWKICCICRKNCFFWQENQRKWFPLEGQNFSFEIGSLSDKNSEQNHTVSSRKKISFHKPEIRICWKIYFHYIIWKNWREWFSVARNLNYVSRNKVLTTCFHKTQ